MEAGKVHSGVTDAPTEYLLAQRTENTNQDGGSAPEVAVVPPGAAAGAAAVKKKRGRPRKYAPDGSLNIALSPKPISSASPVIDFSASCEKLPKVFRQPGGAVRPHKGKYQFEGVGKGELVSCSIGANFTPHIITVNAGEDVMMKIISFSQQGPRAICILSASGAVSSVTLRQPDSSGGTLTYEGRFEILSLTGSFIPSETGGIRNRSGGMSVSLASPDGRVVGGGVAGLLVAASPVQIIVGSFLAINQHEQRPKKLKPEPFMTVAPTAAVPITSVGMRDQFGNQGQHSSGKTVCSPVST
ncbi:AT-hook motif nuclear-localized protein 1-like protein [Drosera capensis]